MSKDMPKKEKQHEKKQEENTINEPEVTQEIPNKQEPISKKEPKVEDATKELEEKIATLSDRLLRVTAEYDNYRKRTTKEKADLLAYGGEKILSELLPVIDDLEIALASIRSADSVDAVREGVELIVQKFFSFLTKQGVTQMDVIEKPFDMASQQAIAMVPTGDPNKKGIVLDCTKKGYTLGDKVLRYADVVIGE